MKLSLFFLFGGDSGGVTPVPIPNTEVKPATSAAVVSNKRRNTDAVFVIFLNGYSLDL